MYILFQTIKSPNGFFAIALLLYSLVIAIVCPKLKKSGKQRVAVFLCVLPVIAALVHLAVYGITVISHFVFFYVLALMPLINLLPGKKKLPVALKSVLSSLAAVILCAVCIFNLTGENVHNFSRMSYTQSFKKMLQTLEKEYCLNSWKKIDYDKLLKDYLPRVEEAEKNKDETAYAEVVAEVTYRFYDSHVYIQLHDEDVYNNVASHFSGNDYGLSMMRLDDGRVIAVLVENGEDSIYDEPQDITKLGIHNGTQIVAWDGREINEAIAGVECVNHYMQFPVKSNEDFFRPAFLAGRGGETVDVTFIGDNGSEKHAQLKKLGDYSDRMSGVFIQFLYTMNHVPNFTSYMYDDKCGYMCIRKEYYSDFYDNLTIVRKGYYPELTEFYAKKIEELKAQGMEYLVIDIRNNGGGYNNVAGALASLFTDEKKYMFGLGYEDEKGYHVTEDQYIFPDGRYKDLPVVVLVNAQCVSAGDGMAKFLGECDNVTLMGLTSSGGVNQNNGGRIYLTKNLSICYPDFLTLSSEGVPLIDTDQTRENRIPLEVKIPMTKEFALKLCDFGAGDVQLEYAADYLAKTKKEKEAN